MACLTTQELETNLLSSQSNLDFRKLNYGDKERVCKWMSSSYILHHSFVIPGPNCSPRDFATKQYAERYFETLIKDKRRITFAILSNKRHIGNVGLKSIDRLLGVTECFIEIGEKDLRNRGFGYLAMSYAINFAFYKLELKQIDLDVLEFNYPAIKLYARLGFETIGVSAWHYDEFGQYWRVLQMSLNKSRL
jgi:RimJ/RimL family protein N-acetyltransferase